MPFVLTPLALSGVYTYAGLKADVASYLKRSNLTNSIPTFIRLAEDRIARELRLRAQLTSVDLTTAAGVSDLSLPDNFLEAKAITYADAYELEVGTLDQVYAERRFRSGGRPHWYAVLGSTLSLGVIPGDAQTVSLTYYARWPSFIEDTDSNWLLTNHRSLYLFAAMAEAQPFMLEDERTAVWESKWAADKDRLQTSDRAAEMSGTTLRVRSR